MIFNKDNYLTTGEFAKLCDVTKQTLIFYDQKKVFSPQYKDKNNYRYYSINQHDTFDILISLRETGMPLEEIKNYLDERTPELLISMLSKQENKIKKQINKLEKINRKIDHKITTTKHGLSTMKQTGITVENLQQEYLLITDLYENDYMVQLIDFIKHINSTSISSGYPIGAMVSKNNILEKKYTKITNYFIQTEKKISDVHIKPAGLYACFNHIGSYASTSDSYQKLISYIKENRYEIIGDSYEKPLIDFFSAKLEIDYLTEISIPIKKIGNGE